MKTIEPLRARLRARRGAASAGFSLVEVMVAAFLIIIIFWGLMRFYVGGRKHIDYEEDRRKATSVGQERLEQARRWSYSYLTALAGSQVDSTMVVDGRTYQTRFWVNPAGEPAPPNDDVLVAKVEVTWETPVDYVPSGPAPTRTIDVTTLIARRYP